MSYEKMKAKDLSMEIARRLYPGDNGHHARLRSCAAYDGVSYLCDSWEKMGLLIQEKKLSVGYEDGTLGCGTPGWWCHNGKYDEETCSFEILVEGYETPLRAAAEVWLMMGDKKRGNV